MVHSGLESYFVIYAKAKKDFDLTLIEMKKNVS